MKPFSKCIRRGVDFILGDNAPTTAHEHHVSEGATNIDADAELFGRSADAGFHSVLPSARAASTSAAGIVLACFLFRHLAIGKIDRKEVRTTVLLGAHSHHRRRLERATHRPS